tara:strand:- start:21 stop:518 length:498 start_codon:yes stop_codon:yes gene_type:complete
MAKVPIYEKLGKMSPKKLSAEVGKRQINLERFEFATSDTIRSLSKLENEIKRVEKRIVNSLEKDNTAEALSDILQLRVLRVEEMVELSGLSILRANRFYNKLHLDVAKGIEAGVLYDEESIKGMVPDDLKSVVSTAVDASNFYDILRKYKSKLNQFAPKEEEDES